MGWWVEKNPQLLLGLGGILHTWWHLSDAVEKRGQGIQASRDLQLFFTNAEEEKNLLPMYSQGGQAIHIQRFPQRAKRVVLNLQINQKHFPGN